ncbi:MAG TPA: DUF1611 domain-containing protein [Woeseiaceae bacterium]
MRIKTPYLLFLGEGDQAKTSSGVAYWRPEICAGQLRLPGCSVDLGLADISIEEAASKGVKTLLIGVAPHGGKMPAHWVEVIRQALLAGLDIAAGLHTRIASIPEVRQLADSLGRQVFDVRHPDREFAVGTGEPRSGKRLLTVGTDCEVGKMFTALALQREMRQRGMQADFRATGQTGIFIAGTGVSVDAVVSDFVSGAAEFLSPAATDEHWDLVEGQGCLLHPAYAAVTLGLVHGSQPQAMVLCHVAGREALIGFPRYRIPSFARCVALYEEAASLTSPGARCIGMSINTSRLDADAATRYLAEAEQETGLPCVDAVRTGVGRLVDILQ